MNKISDITRQDILDIIKDGFTEEFDEPVYDGEIGNYITEAKIYMPFNGRLGEIAFFARLYDLEKLPSFDHRYKNALNDISCHLRWGDYEDCWFFQDQRFKLMQDDGDEPLLNFICEMLHPAVRIEKSVWKAYLDKFNDLLRADGYELYAAQHISGRDIYKPREYRGDIDFILVDNLFSVRYKELIQYGDGKPTDNISASVSYSAKKHFCKVMIEFAEPKSIRRSRYDSFIDNTDALNEAIRRLNEAMDFSVINMTDSMFSPCYQEEILASYFTPFIFDVIELQYDELSRDEKSPFQTAINASFQKDSVSFQLTDRGLIEPVTNHEVLSTEIISSINSVKESGVRDLLNEAIEKHMQPTLQAHRDAVEKIWDALERLKTYYTSLDKKTSANQLVTDMANGRTEYYTIFDAEFKALTDIGNDFRIRHHETSKIDISDIRHYDYFFNRCLSLIATAIQFLK